MAWPVKNLPKHSKRMACWLWLACNGSCASSTLLTGHLKPMSVGHDPMLASWQQPVAQRQPKQWAKAQPNSSTWLKRKFHHASGRVLKQWTGHYNLDSDLRVKLRPHTAGSELLELTLTNASGEKKWPM